MQDQRFLDELYKEYKLEPNKSNVLVVDQKQPLFSESLNPNKDIFVVPTQEGSDRDDQWNGSIGDAVMNHMRDMQHRELEMQHFLHTNNGNIFRIETNVGITDQDGSRKASRQIMDVFRNQSSTPEEKKALIAFFHEEVEENRRRREEKEDALDNVTVSYDDWEKFPQMMKDWEVPSTPKPMYIYAGNSSQKFYDAFPEHHPDAERINRFIAAVNNIDWDDFTEKTAEYFEIWLSKHKWTVPSVQDHLESFCYAIASDDSQVLPQERMIQVLQKIEYQWNKAKNGELLKDFHRSAPIQTMLTFYNENKKDHANGKLVWNKIGQLGKSLFAHREEMTSTHWHKYRQLKKKFAPRLIVGNIDMNRAGLQDLQDFFMKSGSRTLEQSKRLSRDVFYARPFMTIEEIADKSLIDAEDIVGNSKNSSIISIIKHSAKAAIKSRNKSLMGMKANELVSYQQKNPDVMTEEDWSVVWQTYRVCKKIVNNSLG